MVKGLPTMTAAFDTMQINTVVARKGVKIASVSRLGGERVFWTIGGRVQHEPRDFADATATRVDLTIRADDFATKRIGALDEWCKVHVALHSERLLGSVHTLDEVSAKHISCLKPNNHTGGDDVRLKMSLGGISAVKLWGHENQPCKSPSTWAGRNVTMRARVRSLWISGIGLCVTLDVTDVRFAAEELCPECGIPLEFL